MELACPQCGSTNREDSVDFPFCTHCHEPLVKCAYCVHFDAAAGVCRDRKSGRDEVAPEDGVDCGRYRSILATAVAFTRRIVSPANWVLAVAGILFALIVVGTLIHPSLPAASSAPVRVRAMWESPVKAGEPFDIKFTVTNSDTRASSGAVRLAIPAAFQDRFKVLSVSPLPTQRPSSRPQGQAPTAGAPDKRYYHYFEFPSVLPQGQRVITFRLVTVDRFLEQGFPFQDGPGVGLEDPKYSYDLTGEKNSDALEGLGVNVYNARSEERGIFEAPRVFRVEVGD